MPGLTISTDSVSPRTSATPSGAPQIQPQPQSQAPSAPTTTNPSANAPQSPPRSTSPVRPPISPITPTLPATELPPPPNAQSLPPPAASVTPSFSAGRQTFTHNQPVPDAAATAIPPPRPEPIDFDANPDVLALKSAISILQLQRQRATNDIRALGAAKDAAAADPQAFLADLTTGKIRGQQDPLFPTAQESESSSSKDESDEEATEQTTSEDAPEGTKPADGEASAMDVDPTKSPQRKSKSKKTAPAEPPKPWKDLPRPQNVVRCPPINWAQYAVVGDSLDKLHAEQRARPSQGQPAVVGADGTFEFKGASDGNRTEFVGVAAPYAPGRDKIDKKPRGGRR